MTRPALRRWLLSTLPLLLLSSCGERAAPGPQPDAAAAELPAEPGPPEDPLERLRGVMSEGEFARLNGERLVDLAGETVHAWDTGYAPGGWCYLLDDGSLLHAGRQDEDPKFRGGGIGGVIRRLAPDGEVLWRYDFADELRCQHHDLEPLPNGNVLFIAWERMSQEEAIALGRAPDADGAAGLWTDAVFEVRPTPPVGGELVWSWHAKDHLVQARDSKLPHFGQPQDHPGRIDLNFDYVPTDEVTEEQRRAEAERQRQMAALGYGGGDAPEPAPAASPPPPSADRDRSGDWMHTNAVDYDAVNDLIVLSSPELCEIFVIDHSTTTAEAATEQGGRLGRGGALLWRWGNPRNFGVGAKRDQALFYQHDPNWLPSEKEGELRLLVFNNGGDRPDGNNRSQVMELVVPFDPARGFEPPTKKGYAPAAASWVYEDKATFFSPFISGARRLANGNTLICSGAPGRIFEVTPDSQLVWDFFNPYGGDFEAPDHAGKAPPLALYRADRYPSAHPGVRAVLAAAAK